MIDYLKRIIIVKEKSLRCKIKGSVKIIKEKQKIKLVAELISSDLNFNDCIWCVSGEEKFLSQNMQNSLKFDYPLNDDFHFFKGASSTFTNTHSLHRQTILSENTFSDNGIFGYLPLG